MFSAVKMLAICLEALSGSEHLEDPAHDRGGIRVGFETVEPLTQPRFFDIRDAAGAADGRRRAADRQYGD